MAPRSRIAALLHCWCRCDDREFRTSDEWLFNVVLSCDFNSFTLGIMNLLKKGLLGFVGSAVVVAACSENTPTAAKPEIFRSLAHAVLTTNLFVMSDTGLVYAGTTEQLGDASGRSFSDATIAERALSKQELEDASQRVGIEMLSNRLSGSRPAFAESVAPGSAKLRPRLKNAVSRPIGSDARGRAISIEASSAKPRHNAITSSVLVANGDAIAIIKHRWKGNGRNLVPQNTVITLLDSLGRPQVVQDVHIQTSQSVGSWQRTKSGLELASNALLSFVQPDALHAMPRDDIDDWACLTESLAVGAATTTLAAATAGVFAATSAALLAGITAGEKAALAAEALLLCPEAVPLCAAAAAAAGVAATAGSAWALAKAAQAICEGLVVATTAALGYATGALIACREREQARRDSVDAYNNPIYSGSPGGGGEGESCETEWWISYNNGATWSYAYSTFGGCPI